MSSQYWRELLISGQSDGSALTNSTTETSLLPAPKLTLPANYFQIGRVINVRAMGRISNVVTTPGTLTFNLKFGSTTIATSGALNLNTVAKTNVSWWLEWMLTCRAIGASANLMHQGEWTSESVVGSPANTAGGAGTMNLPVSAPAVGSNFDSAASQQLDLTATFSVANASNSIQLHQYVVESLN